jgi:Zn-dependent protease
MKSSLHLGKIMGIPIGVNYSWFIIFFLITATLAQYVFPELYPNWSTLACWIVGLSTSFLFFASLIFHELAHSFVALKKGIEVRSITLFIFGGAARIAREASSPGTEFFMAVAGPLSSVALAGLFALIWLLGENTYEPVAAIGFYLCWINLALAVFNILPGFPLDGGRVLRSFVWWRSGNYWGATRVATLTGQALGCLLILVGVVIGSLVYWFSGLWLAFIGGFLYLAARASYRQAKLREGLRGLAARDLMTSDCQEVPAEMTLEAVANHQYRLAGHRCLFVSEGGKVRGIIARQDTKLVPKRRWNTTSVAEVMVPMEKIGVIHPDEDGLTVLEKMEKGSSGLLLVVCGGEIVGVIERDRLLEVSRGRLGAEA